MPLHGATRLGNLGSVKIPLEAGANPNAWNLDGRTPLQVAPEKDEPALVHFLVKAGAKPKR